MAENLARFIRATVALADHLPKRERTLDEYGEVIQSVAEQDEPFLLDHVKGDYQKAATVCRVLAEKGLLGRNAIGRTGVFWWIK